MVAANATVIDGGPRIRRTITVKATGGELRTHELTSKNGERPTGHRLTALPELATIGARLRERALELRGVAAFAKHRQFKSLADRRAY